MSFIELSPTNGGEVSSDFIELLNRLEPLYQQHIAGKKARMMIVGECKSYQEQFPQRSIEHRLINQSLADEGWDKDTISRAYIAYKEYQKLKANVNPEFQALAEAATIYQLLELSKAKDGTLAYDAALYLKRHKKLPSVSQLQGRKRMLEDPSGRVAKCNASFEFINKRSTFEEEEVDALPLQQAAPTPAPMVSQAPPMVPQAVPMLSPTPLVETDKCAEVIDTPILTDLEKLQAAVGLISSIKDVDALYANPQTHHIVSPVNHLFQVFTDLGKPVTARKYV